MMNRNGSLIGIIGDLLSHIKSFNFSSDLLNLLTHNTVRDDLLVNAELSSETSRFIGNIAKLVKTQEESD